MALMSNRKIHRWLGIGAVVFFLSVSITGVVLQFEQLFGAEEAGREELASMRSPLRMSQTFAVDADSFERARAAVATRYGDQPVSAVDWLIKGKTPTFVFHLDGKEPIKVGVAANTGVILSANSDDEDWLIKLHTGEIIGDGGKVLGLFWGVALVLMSITGTIIYIKMLAARNKGRSKAVTGLRRYFWLLLLATMLLPAMTAPAFAGSPFLTDDPGFIPQGFEVKLASAFDKNVGGETITGPILDLNYTLTEHLKLNLTLAGKSISPVFGDNVTGLADTDFKFKWRFNDETADSWLPALSIAPNITIPTASESRGLGDDVWRLRVPVQAGKTFGSWYFFAEGGYQFALKSGVSDAVVYGTGGQYTVNDRWTVGAELNGSVATGDSQNWGLLLNVGTTYQATKTLQIQGSLGRTVRSADRGGSKVLAQFFLQWQFI